MNLRWWAGRFSTVRTRPRRTRADSSLLVSGFLDAIARGLRSGHSLVTSVAIAAAETPEPLGAEVRALVRRVEGGVPLRDAASAGQARTANVPLRRALAAIAIASEAGGADASSFDALANALRARAAAARELRVLAIPVRWSALLIAAAPVATLALVALVDAGSLARATSTPLGVGSIIIGLALDVIGWWWISVLTRIDHAT